TRGVPSGAASKRYSAASVTMKTPPVLSTENELPLASWRSIDLVAPLLGSTVPTTPSVVANQIRPLQSGSAEMILSSSDIAPLRSYWRCSVNPGPVGPPVSPTTQISLVVVGITARSAWSR